MGSRNDTVSTEKPTGSNSSVEDHELKRTGAAGHSRAVTGRSLAILTAVAVYVAIALYAYWPASLFSNSRLAGGGQGDPAGQVAGLAWIAFALSHHTNPFFTNWINYPDGVNLASNAVAPAVGLILAPVTMILGPIAAYNLALCLAFITAALAMFFVLQRFVKSIFSAFLGGLLYGFSPYMVGQGLGHLAILYTSLLPVAFYLLYRLLEAQSPGQRRRLGLVLGLVLAVQVYLSVEILADFVTVAVILVLGGALLHPRQVIARLQELWSPLCIGIVAFIIVGAFPIWTLVLGPQHLSGPPQPLAILDMFHSDLLGPLVPTALMRYAPHWLSAIGARWSAGNFTEYGIYLGAPIVAAITSTIVWLRRISVVRLSAVGGLLALVLSMGTRLTIAGHLFNSVPMPFALFNHLPLFSGEIPARYSLFLQLFAAVILAFGVDRFFSVLRAKSKIRAHGAPRNRITASPIVMVLSLALFVPLVPVFPYAQGPSDVPPFFTMNSLKSIPFGSVLLAYPYPSPPIYNQAQLWQAEARYRFKVLGGYAIFRTPSGSGSPIPPILQPSVVQDIFYSAMVGSGTLSSSTKVTLGEIRRFLRKYHITTVAIDPIGNHPSLPIRYMTAVLGPPVVQGGMTLWFDVPRLLRS